MSPWLLHIACVYFAMHHHWICVLLAWSRIHVVFLSLLWLGSVAAWAIGYFSFSLFDECTLWLGMYMYVWTAMSCIQATVHEGCKLVQWLPCMACAVHGMGGAWLLVCGSPLARLHTWHQSALAPPSSCCYGCQICIALSFQSMRRLVRSKSYM